MLYKDVRLPRQRYCGPQKMWIAVGISLVYHSKPEIFTSFRYFRFLDSISISGFNRSRINFLESYECWSSAQKYATLNMTVKVRATSSYVNEQETPDYCVGAV